MAGLACQFFASLSQIATKFIYESQPDITPMQMVALRSIVAVIMIAIMLNSRLKYIMWDSVQSELVKSLAFKVVQNNIGVSVYMGAVKFVPLTTIVMSDNCTPFIILVLAFFILGERTSLL